MFTALEEWHVIPWTTGREYPHHEYPEVRYSMLRLLNFKEERIKKDRKKAELEAKQNKTGFKSIQ